MASPSADLHPAMACRRPWAYGSYLVVPCPAGALPGRVAAGLKAIDRLSISPRQLVRPPGRARLPQHGLGGADLVAQVHPVLAAGGQGRAPSPERVAQPIDAHPDTPHRELPLDVSQRRLCVRVHGGSPPLVLHVGLLTMTDLPWARLCYGAPVRPDALHANLP